MSARKEIDKAEADVKEQKTGLLAKLEEDGVANPSGLGFIVGSLSFIALVPVTSFLAKRHGPVENAVDAICQSVAFAASLGSNNEVSQNGKIAALSAVYIFVAYAFSRSCSVAGVMASRKGKYDNNHPRLHAQTLHGLPLRLRSAHYHLIENFAAFALAAALAQAMAPGDQTLINLLGLHVILKIFVHWPSYVLNISPLRSLAHPFATSAVINVVLKLSQMLQK